MPGTARAIVAWIVVFLFAAFFLALNGVTASTLLDDQEDTAVRKGQLLYSQYCRSCHGDDARGDGPAASAFKVQPTDLTQITKKYKGFPTEKEKERMGPPVGEDLDIVFGVAILESGTVWVRECEWGGPGPFGGRGVRWFDGSWHGADSPVASGCATVGPEGETARARRGSQLHKDRLRQSYRSLLLFSRRCLYFFFHSALFLHLLHVLFIPLAPDDTIAHGI